MRRGKRRLPLVEWMDAHNYIQYTVLTEDGQDERI